MVTTPMISHPHNTAITSTPHFEVTFGTAGAQSLTGVARATRTLYPQGNASATTDLIEWLEVCLNTNSASMVFSCTLGAPGTGRLRISATGPDTFVGMSTLTSEVTLYDLGLALTTATTAILASTSIINGAYRIPSLWCPSTQDFGDLTTRRDVAVSATADSGVGVDDIYTGHKVSSHDIPGVFGALIRTSVVSVAAHAQNVDDLTTGDTLAPLESWLVSLHSLLGGARPTLRWTPDIATPATFRSVYLANPALLSGVEGWITDTNLAPLFHDLSFELVEVA